MSQDHIIVPKSTLLQFSDPKSGIFHYLDLADNKIYTAHAKTYNTGNDYYPPDKEQYLAQRIETPMGRLRKLLNSFTSGEKVIQLPNTVKADAIRCIAVQILRNPDYIKKVQSESIFGDSIPWQFYSPLHHPGYDLIDKCINLFEKALINYDVNICVINEHNQFSFILPPEHFFSTGKNIFLVLSPFHAILLLPTETNAKYYSQDGYLAYAEIEQYSEILPLYLKIIKEHMKDRDHCHIIGLKNQLQKLQSLISDFDAAK